MVVYCIGWLVPQPSRAQIRIVYRPGVTGSPVNVTGGPAIVTTVEDKGSCPAAGRRAATGLWCPGPS